MGITENKITVLGKNSEKVALEVVKNLIDDDSAVVTLFYGSDVKEKEAESVAKELKRYIKTVTS